nr:hypothetical protein [Achromobacter pulmonis]
MQISTHGRQMVHDRNAVLSLTGSVANAREFEQLGLLKRTRAQDHLSATSDCSEITILPVLDADHVSLEQHAQH